MPRKKYQADPEYIEHKLQSIVGKRILGGCLKAEGASDRAIVNVYQHAEEIEELALVKYTGELWVDPSDVERWVLTPEGKRWAFPKFGVRAT